LEEEYGIPVERGGELHAELERSVTRAVRVKGVALWLEAGRVALTAQLISKTSVAAMFGDLYTDPALRGHGRATRGLTAFCSWLMTESQHVTLRVGTTNAPAVRLYERVGFSVVDSFESSLRVDD
jgi:predicted GNAT family acetyltransferase